MFSPPSFRSLPSLVLCIVISINSKQPHTSKLMGTMPPASKAFHNREGKKDKFPSTDREQGLNINLHIHMSLVLDIHVNVETYLSVLSLLKFFKDILLSSQ